MKRNKIIYNRWLRTLLLSSALLIGGDWKAWGQETETRPIISLTWEEKAHNDVHTEEKIIYVDPVKQRVLSIPDLNINNRSDGDDSYNWFVHWYVLNSNDGTTGTIQHESITVNGIDASNRGGSIGVGTDVTINGTNTKQYKTSDFFVRVKETQGLLWSNRLKTSSVIPLIDNKRGLGIDASAIAYTLPSNYTEGDIIYCDVSVYQDGIWTPNSSSSDVVGTYKEPTLLKRYKYVIKKADDCPAFNGESETYEIDFPNKTKSINLSMPYAPDNYFWKTDDGTIHQGVQFVYRINDKGEFKPFHLVTKTAELKLQQNQKIKIEDLHTDKENIVEVKAICSAHSNEMSHVLATFKFRPIENAEFKLEKDLDKGKDDDRWPRGNTEKYELIGIVDFDQKEQPTEIKPGENMSSKPVGAESEARTSYGFIRKDGASLLDKDSKCWTSYPGMYGLFRSANAEKSKDKGDCYVLGDVKRYYKWITPRIEGAYDYPNKIYDTRDLHDRTYAVTEETETPKYGYFYYIDATDEPGVLVSVPIDGSLCGNTELTVTGWLADMTRPGYDKWSDGHPLPLAPNLNIVLKGVTPEGEVVLHRFTTGDALTDYRNNDNLDIPVTDPTKIARDKIFNINLMKWQQFHYKFIISEEKIAGCTNFRLEVQNNEPHTDGADYAIDDIRIFKRKPEVGIVQAGDLCDTELKDVRFVTSYSNIMNVMGLKSNEEVVGINKDVVWDENALPSALVGYMKKTYGEQAKDMVEKYFTKIYYSIYNSDNKNVPLEIDYNGDGEPEYCRVSYLSTHKEDMEWVNQSSGTGSKDIADKIYSMPLEIGKFFSADKWYVARITTQPLGEGGEPIACDACALIGDPFKLSVAGNRFTIYKGDDMKTDIKAEEVEQNETYKIVGNFRYLGEEGWETVQNAVFDWFIGTLEEFNTAKVTVDNKEYTIQEALNVISTSQDTRDEFITALTKKFGEYSDSNKEGKFVFNKPFFDYKMVNKYQLIVGLPRAIQGPDITIEENLYCPEPIEIKLGGTPPTIDPGDPDVPDPDPKDPEDPDDPKDDPKEPQPDKDPADGSHVRSVRVGLVQIQDMQKNNGTLRIPIYSRKSATGEIFIVDETNTNIKVIETSDNDRRKGLIDKQVATLTVLKDVYVNMDENKPKWDENYFKIQFNEEAVNSTTGFREGFWYMVEIPYAVKDNNGSVVYHSSMKLTLKIVPEYVTWVGSTDGMHNWNNDGPNHWRRSTNSELYMGDDNATTGAQKNGTHNDAYTPMRFTKVTIYGKAQKTNASDNLNSNAYAACPYLYELKENIGKQEKDPNNVLLNMNPGELLSEIGAATKNIEYDLLADPDYEKVLFRSTNPDKEQGHSYSCVRFYGNTCDDIYIKPESEILHTEFLTYNTAHVDYEMEPNRWYMLASPLKGVVSGDMYLPTGTGVGSYARQETPAFEKITYENNTKYTRWNPAVYMRGWKKAVSVVYPNTVNEPTKYGIATNWSNLYNDVDVPFTPGTGFSIGTNAKSDFSGKVLFRLPKNDDSYNYYVKDEDKTNDNKELTKANRNGNGRFIISPNEEGKDPVVNYNVQTTEMFGNPFMSHLDMTKFFPNGQGTYYILSKSGIETDILLGNGYSISTEESDPKYVAPLQSFIVPNMTSAQFTTEMIAKAPTGNGIDNGLRSATTAPADEPLPQLRITATRDGVRNTAVVAGLVTASDSYVEGEDAALLINEEVAAPQVYTLAGNQMTAINVTPELTEIPLGIYGKDATPVELSFRVSGAMKNVKLVDKQTGKRYDVTDGLTLTVPGNTSGRYFLNGSIATSNEIIARNRIIFYNSAPGRIDISSVDPLSEVTVYDIAGRALRTLRNLNTPTASAEHLAPGIYVVRAESGSQVVSEKVEVK